jgi:peptide/nickel transport system substrate-binding protein
VRYSDGTTVRPGDFRRALERVFRLTSDGAFHYADILGARSCAVRPATCDLSHGIVTDPVANTVTFHLTRRDPDFLFRLALPFAVAVPSGTPARVTDKAPIPATGPYKIERYAKDRELVLGRNPASPSGRRQRSRTASPIGSCGASASPKRTR